MGHDACSEFLSASLRDLPDEHFLSERAQFRQASDIDAYLRFWGSLDATYYTGGRTTLNGILNNDLQQNWRLGGTLAIPVDVHNSIKLYASSGVSARTGNNFDLLGIAWQFRWGGGL